MAIEDGIFVGYSWEGSKDGHWSLLWCCPVDADGSALACRWDCIMLLWECWVSSLVGSGFVVGGDQEGFRGQGLALLPLLSCGLVAVLPSEFIWTWLA